jgi:hypothetical protein
MGKLWPCFFVRKIIRWSSSSCRPIGCTFLTVQKYAKHVDALKLLELKINVLQVPKGIKYKQPKLFRCFQFTLIMYYIIPLYNMWYRNNMVFQYWLCVDLRTYIGTCIGIVILSKTIYTLINSFRSKLPSWK